MHRSMFSCFGDEELIQAQTQKVAKIEIDPRGAQDIDPKVEERQVSQNAIKEFDRECSISRLERALQERAGNDRVGELLLCAPGSERGETDSTSRRLRHNQL